MSVPDIELPTDRTLGAIVGVTALSLLARLFMLGDRVAHWDEGRVGYDILTYMETGMWEYRPIVHGPFLPQVNKHLFALAGANDFTARLAVALVGGLLPLSVWLYRDYLADRELIAVALFLAADPILLYYSRFMRNDVLVAAFAFAGLGFYVRFRDTGLARYLYAGTAVWALAFTAKENALLYPVTILGALVLLLDHRLFLTREDDPGWTSVATSRVWRAGGAIRRHKLPLLVAAVEFLAVIVFFYAPRAPPGGGLGLWNAFADPSMFPAVIEAATIGAAEKMVDLWLSGSLSDHGYLPFLAHYLEVLGSASGPLALLAVIGFVADRYSGERPRDLVAMTFYWGSVSVLGYPIAVDIKAAWSVSHAVVPLAVPAAVGALLIYRWGMDAYRSDDDVGTALAGIILLLLVGQIAATGVATSYANPQSEDNVLVQFAQPEGEMRPALRDMREAAADNEGLDVLWYGPHFLIEDESRLTRPPVGGQCKDLAAQPRMCWYNRLPMPWYTEAFDAEVDSARNVSGMERIAGGDLPPVIITRSQEAFQIDDRLRKAGYEKSTYEGRLFNLEFVFYIEEQYAGP